MAKDLYYKEVIQYRQDDARRKLVIEVRLRSKRFSIQTSVYELHCKTWANIYVKNYKELVAKYAPQYLIFFDLDGCFWNGEMKLWNIEYYFNQKDYDAIKRTLRLKDNELDDILLAADDMKFLIYTLMRKGIIDRWHNIAEEARKFIEEKCGEKWIAQENVIEEDSSIKLTEEEIDLIKSKKKSGYYSKAKIEERRKDKKKSKLKELLDYERNRYKRAFENLALEHEIKKNVIFSGITSSNFIFYPSKGLVVFNWQDYGDKISKEEFDRFMFMINLNGRFSDIKFQFGK